MAFDAHLNFAYSLVAAAPFPASSGTSLSVTVGGGVLFPTPPFNATVWPTAVLPLTSNAEIVRVTAITGDTLTISRQQEGTAPRAILISDQIAAGPTVKTFTDIEAAVLSVSIPVSSVNGHSGAVVLAASDVGADASGAAAGEQARALAAEALAELLAHKNQPSGYAGLDVNGLLASSTLPSLAITDTHVVASQAAMLAISGAHQGSVAIRTDTGATYICAAGDPTQLATWVLLPAVNAVTSVNGQVGPVNLVAANVGADATGLSAAETARAQTAEALLAPKASPVFTGTPTVPTAGSSDNSTKAASTAFVKTAVAASAATANASAVAFSLVLGG